MISSKEYSPFLTWNRNDPVTLDSITPAFRSLVSMVRDNLAFDQELLDKVTTFISSITSIIKHRTIDDFLMAVGQGSLNPAAEFVDLMIVLVSSSHPSIFKATLSFIRKCGTRKPQPVCHLAHVRQDRYMEGKWRRHLAQRENIAADTRTGRVQ
ncbi:hypothetical protein BLNAU_9391 [Blattamonas nauphoetae]|uniref:Uncharacterized protein n=1 Tax=Blattamonas nauphoetae TaxID=2049346 RepID=A0ABQ9XW43_9EUKA|nr:hypothetical protein BLNAU_9388 [Blattamonas nauphoetae]KAK2955701.1 hypothetical protein BLNAU_9391 [Blattamonas nauphoetae]